MTGKYLAELMENGWLKEGLAKHARRYSKRLENQEEYIQDAWLRIAECQEGESLNYYAEQGRKSIKATYDRRWYRVRKERASNPNGISVTGKDEKPLPKRAVRLYRNKYLDPESTTLDWQYYKGQEQEMYENARYDIEWYNQYEGFESLEEKERSKIIHKFMNSGYQVGMPIGATPGKKTRFHEMYYTVDRGIVQETQAPRKVILEKNYPQPGFADTTKIDLSNWHKLKSFGGSDEWIEWVDGMIRDLDRYNSGLGIVEQI